MKGINITKIFKIFPICWRFSPMPFETRFKEEMKRDKKRSNTYFIILIRNSICQENENSVNSSNKGIPGTP